jgi:hypothetical protein
MAQFRIKELESGRFRIQQRLLWLWFDYRLFNEGKNDFKKCKKALKRVKKLEKIK